MDPNNMSSVRKKLDEYHLKVLRELVTLPANKYCFDCHQRGPTYVNVTIGSFVCTKCSGMLRGLTPPHRVKSISMATFTPEEMEFIKSRGNDYCQRVWLGLHSADPPTKDELQIKDFMISKYEKKRYYVDPAIAPTINGLNNKGNSNSLRSSPPKISVPVSATNNISLPSPPNTLQLKTTKIPPAPCATNLFTPDGNKDFFATNFGSPTSDPFSSPLNNTSDSTSGSEASFANFDNNPIFTPPSQTFYPTCYDPLSDLLAPSTSAISLLSQPLLSSNYWSFSNIGLASQPSTKPPDPTPPAEDRYAALKDLDCLMKTQQMASVPPETQPAASTSEWTVNGSNPWNSSVFDTPPNVSDSTPPVPSNPFNSQNGNLWNANNTNNSPFSGNPFLVNRAESAWSVTPNSQHQNRFPISQSMNFASTKAWIKNESPISNPFTFSSSPRNGGHHSSNPFL